LLIVLEEMNSQAKSYAERFGGEPYLSQRQINDTIEDPDASREQVHETADELIGFYDELFGEDTSDLREEFKDDILYDMSVGEILTPRADEQTAVIFGSGLVDPGKNKGLISFCRPRVQRILTGRYSDIGELRAQLLMAMLRPCLNYLGGGKKVV